MDAQKIDDMPSVSYAMLAKHLGPNGANMLSRTVWKDGIDIEVPDGGIQTLCKEYAAQTLASKEAELVRLKTINLKGPDWHDLLSQLVAALDNSFISSWQSTAGWQKELDQAQAALALTQPPKEPT